MHTVSISDLLILTIVSPSHFFCIFFFFFFVPVLKPASWNSHSTNTWQKAIMPHLFWVLLPGTRSSTPLHTTNVAIFIHSKPDNLLWPLFMNLPPPNPLFLPPPPPHTHTLHRDTDLKEALKYKLHTPAYLVPTDKKRNTHTHTHTKGEKKKKRKKT